MMLSFLCSALLIQRGFAFGAVCLFWKFTAAVGAFTWQTYFFEIFENLFKFWVRSEGMALCRVTQEHLCSGSRSPLSHTKALVFPIRTAGIWMTREFSNSYGEFGFCTICVLQCEVSMKWLTMPGENDEQFNEKVEDPEAKWKAWSCWGSWGVVELKEGIHFCMETWWQQSSPFQELFPTEERIPDLKAGITWEDRISAWNDLVDIPIHTGKDFTSKVRENVKNYIRQSLSLKPVESKDLGRKALGFAHFHTLPWVSFLRAKASRCRSVKKRFCHLQTTYL